MAVLGGTSSSIKVPIKANDLHILVLTQLKEGNVCAGKVGEKKITEMKSRDEDLSKCLCDTEESTKRSEHNLYT